MDYLILNLFVFKTTFEWYIGFQGFFFSIFESIMISIDALKIEPNETIVFV